MSQFQNKVAVVTGASRGIGLCMTRMLAEQGAHVFFAARREEMLREAETALHADGLSVTAVRADVASDADCKTLIDRALGDKGQIDILVNSAGISGAQKPSWEVESHEMDEVMRVNVYGALACIRNAAPSMIARRSGAIINISSFTGKRPAVNRAVYATSKMALVGLSRTVALELAPHQVRCNVVSPGPVEGERVQEVIGRAAKAQNKTEEEIRKEFVAWAPMGEIPTEEEICGSIAFLASDAARHITGQDLNVDGGIVMF
ncbi:MAG: SDR family oxidoreductase [Pseudomonadota bacterium]|nr:SDR family oxidoreductase [Pseudomonadota bacterium]